MCGIVGYIGFREAWPIVLKGLKRLEYRGYDSAGIALIDNENLRLTMAKAARNYAVAYADQRHQLNAIENIYKEALVGK